jgi:DNA-binding beta-propeller fold protein YncE
MVYRNGNLYLADLFAKQVIVTDANGRFQEGYDINRLIASAKVEEEKPGTEKNIVGFTVDQAGNLLFTVPTLFQAFRLSPDRKMTGFGEPGSLPGKFNVAAGIATDDRGYIYVADTLRSVVMVFDNAFNFQIEFSQRGLSPDSLIAPKALSVDTNGRVYVSQARRRGVSVFKVTYD